MRYIFLIFFLFGNSVYADSLDQFFSQQSMVTISPVEHNGLPINTRTAYNYFASAICSMLGFNRVVSFQKSDSYKVAKGFKYLTIVNYAGLYMLGTIVAGEGNFIYPIDKLQCAR